MEEGFGDNELSNSNFDLMNMSDDDFKNEFEQDFSLDNPELDNGAAPAATRQETLPGFDMTAGKTWIYPSNMSHRQYQYDIVEASLFDNTLVCLPTGLGKTFIAAVLMYNYFRWYPRGKVVFMAPTKPLVGQQIEACHRIMGIPQSEIKEMTGNTAVPERSRAWASKRVFFLTPQVMSNDLSRGLFPAREVKLLVVDEAHRAQGDYAYCLVARELDRAGANTRILALSATPGTDIPSVQAVLRNLFISRIELRNEESADIVPYTHSKCVDKIVVPMDKDIKEIREKLLAVMEIYTKRLSAVKAIQRGHNPTTYSKYAMLMSSKEWKENPRSDVSGQVRGQASGNFGTVIRLYHSLELLSNQGLRSFFNSIAKEAESGNDKRIQGELNRIPQWRDILVILKEKFVHDSSNKILKRGPVLSQAGGNEQACDVAQEINTSHPKMEKMIEILIEHFNKFEKAGTETKVIIFSEYRDCVTELVACLAPLKPKVRPMSFIGQAGSNGKKGLNQKEQIEVVRRFKSGGYNTLVATCVAEEGLDIGEVDLIVLYDVAKSPIRLVQRMGRTGRKRDGRIVVLVTQGAEERAYNQSLYKKKTINEAILDKSKLEHSLFKSAPRMVPEDITPVCHKMKVVVEKFKPKGAGKGTMNCYLNGAKQKLSKEDYFRRNCGFLTESEEDRYQKIPSFQGTVKRLKPTEELWTGKAFEQDRPGGSDRLDLEEFHLWQADEQPRRCVGQGSLATSYTRLLSLAANSTALKKRVEAAAQENNRNQNGREKKPSGGILDYFQKKQKPTPEVPELTLEGITEELEIAEENEDNFGIDISTVDSAEVGVSPDVEKENTPSKMNANDDREEQLVQDLLPESYFDSGVYSPPSPPSLSSLRNKNASAEFLSKFDVSEAIANVVKRMGIRSPKKRYPPTNEVDVEIQAMPLIVKQNSVEDMFADDSFLEEFIEENKEDTENIDQTPIEDSSNRLKTRTEDAGATFDLESPVMSQASGGQPGEDGGQADSRVSTPLPGSSSTLDRAPLPDLTPLAPHPNPRAALHTDIQPEKMKDVSSDLFDDSDDELLVNLALAPCRAESIYSTSQLLNMMNDTEESVTPTRIKPRINNSKRKLSKVFDEVFDLESSILETAEDRELKEQTKFALDASVTEKHSLSYNEGNLDKADEEFKNQTKLALAASLQECRSTLNDESTERNEMSDDDDSPIIGSRNKKLNVIASQTAHNDDLHNFSEVSAKSSTEEDAVRGETEAKPAGVSEEGETGCRCPVCDKFVTGDINTHIDICLNMNYITQEAEVGAGDLSDPGDPATAAAAGANSPDDSPVLGQRKRKLNVLASQSFGQAGNDTELCIANSLNISDNEANEESSHDKISTPRQKEPKKYKKRINQFLDDEAELSGRSDSMDEEVEPSQVGYDKSFVDDQTQATDDRALYLRLGRASPVARRERPLPPITDAIFSQAVDDYEEDYTKDSFCVGDSFVEYNCDQDTLDLAETRAGAAAVRPPGRAEPSRAKRRRILVAPEADDTVLQPSQARPFSQEQEEESQSLLAAYSTTLQDSLPLREEKIKVLASSSQVTRMADVVSCLRHEHCLQVAVLPLEPDCLSFVVGDTAVVRLNGETEFGPGRERLLERLVAVRESYSAVSLVVEMGRRTGERPRPRTKKLDLLAGELGRAGVRVLHTFSPVQTAGLLAGLAAQQAAAGSDIPRSPLTLWQEEMVRWLVYLPGLSLPIAMRLATTHRNLHHLLTTTPAQLAERGRFELGRAERLAAFLSCKFRPKMTGLPPL